MRGELRAFLKDAELLGWKFVGYGGNSHPRLLHPKTGSRYVLSLTPSDRGGRRHALRDLERVAGVKVRHIKSAHKKKGM